MIPCALGWGIGLCWMDERYGRMQWFHHSLSANIRCPSREAGKGARVWPSPARAKPPVPHAMMEKRTLSGMGWGLHWILAMAIGRRAPSVLCVAVLLFFTCLAHAQEEPELGTIRVVFQVIIIIVVLCNCMLYILLPVSDRLPCSLREDVDEPVYYGG